MISRELSLVIVAVIQAAVRRADMAVVRSFLLDSDARRAAPGPTNPEAPTHG